MLNTHLVSNFIFNKLSYADPVSGVSSEAKIDATYWALSRSILVSMCINAITKMTLW